MSRRTKIIIAAVLAAVVIGVVIWIILILLRAPAPPAGDLAQDAASPPAASRQTAQEHREPPTLITSTAASGSAQLNLGPINLARSFAERYGSYSNQSDFSNIEELYSFMTASLRAEMEDFVATSRSNRNADEPYLGVTTRAISSRFLTQSGARATVIVAAQRFERKGSAGGERTYYQDLELILVEETGVWKVDEARWR